MGSSASIHQQVAHMFSPQHAAILAQRPDRAGLHHPAMSPARQAKAANKP